MTFFVIAFVVFTLLMLAAGKQRKKNTDRTEPKTLDTYVAKPVLTANEKAWFNAIKAGMPNAHLMTQMALNQMVNATGKNWRAAKNKIDPRSIDFVLLNPELEVLLAIEIDDRSHKLEKRQADDAKKNKALSDAGITLMRFPATPVLSSEEIKKQVTETLVAKLRAKTVIKTT